jgi:AcrR family transcriptional regulator
MTKVADTGIRNVRSDARRNIDAVLEASKEAFAESGVHAPVREIAARAGVGVGTVYRHFPRRSDLVTAVFRHEVDACVDLVPTLVAEHEPSEALTLWLQSYTSLVATKRGLAAALSSESPAFEALPACFLEPLLPALGTLLENASSAGQIRDDVAPADLLQAVASLCAAADADQTRRMVALLIDGLRFGSPVALPGD